MKPYMLALLTAFCWGVAPIFEKWSLLRASPLTVITIRSFFISAVLLIICLFTGGLQELRRVDGHLLFLIIMGGLFGGLVGLFIYFWALQQHLASTIVPVAGSYPLFAALLSILLLGEPFSWQRLLGALLVVAGIFLVQ